MNDEQLNDEQLNALMLRCQQAPVGGSLFVKRADLLALIRAYRRLENAALAILENPDYVDMDDVVLMLGRALAEEE